MLISAPHARYEPTLETRLIGLAQSAPWILEALHRARDVMSAPWCIAAGAVRSLAWNSLHGFPLLPPAELDLVYFDASCPRAQDADVAARLARSIDAFEWDVVNQAHAHTLSGVPDSAPFVSLEHAMACWPETATAVGLCLDPEGELQVIAPHGLSDLFGLILRPSPFLRNPHAFQQRLEQKAFVRRWPLLQVLVQ
jgi:uncharacterized protein